MPELPEVEALRLSLQPHILRQTIKQVEVRLPKLVSAKGTARQASSAKKDEFENKLSDRQILNLRRRSKNLIFEFDNGSRLLVHLKMSGQLVFQPKESSQNQLEPIVWGGHPIELSEKELPNKHTHIIFWLSNGTLYYNDVRQFGYLLYYPSQKSLDQSGHFDKLGLEPLDKEFTLENFKTALLKKKGNLKKVFFDQEVVVGLGNIYADEVCFWAKVRPSRSVSSLKPKEVEALHEAIITILPLAVKAGGSSVANYLLADGTKGNYAKQHFVYNRGGLECKICAATLSKTKVAGRTTVYCPNCQK